MSGLACFVAAHILSLQEEAAHYAKVTASYAKQTAYHSERTANAIERMKKEN